MSRNHHRPRAGTPTGRWPSWCRRLHPLSVGAQRVGRRRHWASVRSPPSVPPDLLGGGRVAVVAQVDVTGDGLALAEPRRRCPRRHHRWGTVTDSVAVLPEACPVSRNHHRPRAGTPTGRWPSWCRRLHPLSVGSQRVGRRRHWASVRSPPSVPPDLLGGGRVARCCTGRCDRRWSA